jgi:hypothetical protein
VGWVFFFYQDFWATKNRRNNCRYKCAHPSCPNFDLCAQCEALPLLRHDRSHILLKINHPVPNRQSTPLEYGGELVQYALQQGQIEQALENLQPLQPTPPATVEPANGHSSGNVGVKVEPGAAEVVHDESLESAVASPGEVQPSSEPAHVKVTGVDQEHREFPHFEYGLLVGRSLMLLSGDAAIPAMDATFVADLTIPDGSVMPAGAMFDKVSWFRLQRRDFFFFVKSDDYETRNGAFVTRASRHGLKAQGWCTRARILLGLAPRCRFLNCVRALCSTYTYRIFVRPRRRAFITAAGRL